MPSCRLLTTLEHITAPSRVARATRMPKQLQLLPPASFFSSSMIMEIAMFGNAATGCNMLCGATFTDCSYTGWLLIIIRSHCIIR
jgi:hypothetical protein